MKKPMQVIFSGVLILGTLLLVAKWILRSLHSFYDPNDSTMIIQIIMILVGVGLLIFLVIRDRGKKTSSMITSLADNDLARYGLVMVGLVTIISNAVYYLPLSMRALEQSYNLKTLSILLGDIGWTLIWAAVIYFCLMVKKMEKEILPDHKIE